jgi:STAS-like domain of unknown function (DUF4325)
MARAERKTEIEHFILSAVDFDGRDIARRLQERFGITRQAASKHIGRMVENGDLKIVDGTHKPFTYHVPSIVLVSEEMSLKGLSEDKVWYDLMASYFESQPQNIRDIAAFGFTEMVNNALDHSGGDTLKCKLRVSGAMITLSVADNGIGIFDKIQQALGLADKRHSVLELAKGKFTTDPRRHSGEGIFFSSRAFDRFTICSRDLHFYHERHDWLFDAEDRQTNGTIVIMSMRPWAEHTLKQVYDKFSTNGDALYGFTRTILPVRLAVVGAENLVSRSQAKRILAGLDRFQEVIFDFEHIDQIGQSFADEIFRVFANDHTEIDLVAINTKLDVEQMIQRALRAKTEQSNLFET